MTLYFEMVNKLPLRVVINTVTTTIMTDDAATIVSNTATAMTNALTVGTSITVAIAAIAITIDIIINIAVLQRVLLVLLLTLVMLPRATHHLSPYLLRRLLKIHVCFHKIDVVRCIYIISDVIVNSLILLFRILYEN